MSDSMLSPFQREMKERLQIKSTPTKKLLLTCYDKQKYVVHYYLLALYVKLGMRITKVHAVLSFTQRPFLREFVQRNVALRNQSSTDFEKKYYKQINNAVFGKSCQNVRKMRTFELAYDKETAIRRAGAFNCRDFRILSEQCVLYEMKKRKAVANHPLYVAFSILELSKARMYSFIYESLFARLTCPVEICYSDTDSVLTSLQTNDIVEQINKIRDELDLSCYPPDHPLYDPEHKGVMGYFKDEYPVTPIQEVVAIRAKQYSLLLSNSQGISRSLQVAKAKGVKKSVVRKHLLHDVYRGSLFGARAVCHKQCTIQSLNQRMYTVSRVKRCIVPYDEKRYLLRGTTTTLPYGSCEYEGNYFFFFPKSDQFCFHFPSLSRENTAR